MCICALLQKIKINQRTQVDDRYEYSTSTAMQLCRILFWGRFFVPSFVVGTPGPSLVVCVCLRICLLLILFPAVTVVCVRMCVWRCVG